MYQLPSPLAGVITCRKLGGIPCILGSLAPCPLHSRQALEMTYASTSFRRRSMRGRNPMYRGCVNPNLSLLMRDERGIPCILRSLAPFEMTYASTSFRQRSMRRRNPMYLGSVIPNEVRNPILVGSVNPNLSLLMRDERGIPCILRSLAPLEMTYASTSFRRRSMRRRNPMYRGSVIPNEVRNPILVGCVNPNLSLLRRDERGVPRILRSLAPLEMTYASTSFRRRGMRRRNPMYRGISPRPGVITCQPRTLLNPN